MSKYFKKGWKLYISMYELTLMLNVLKIITFLSLKISKFSGTACKTRRGADAAMLIARQIDRFIPGAPFTCGRAFLDLFKQGVNLGVTSLVCFRTPAIFGHELGHNWGLEHERYSVSCLLSNNRDNLVRLIQWLI